LLASLGPLATQILFGREVAANFPECVSFGLAFLFVSLSTPLSRNILVPAGQTRLTLFAATIGAVVGLPLMVILGIRTGIAGIGFGLAASQAMIFLILVLPAIKWLRGDAPLAVPGTRPELY
jgi:PST family polysaccharide transporter